MMDDERRLMGFMDLEWKTRSGVGCQAVMQFVNGYGVSVIDFGYGSDRGLYEIAVLAGDSLCYDTPVTDDVIGYCTPAMIDEIMIQVQQLPAREGAA